MTPQEQWDRLDAFIEQDKYLSSHRGQIAERFGAVNPWYQNVDIRILQDFGFLAGSAAALPDQPGRAELPEPHQLGLGRAQGRQRGSHLPAHLWTGSTCPVTAPAAGLNFTGPAETYIDDPSIFSRWRAQVGLRYFFN